MKIKHLVIGAVLAWSLASGSTAQSQPGPSAGIDPLEASTQAIINRFDQAIRECGLSPPYVPKASVATSANLVSYDPSTRLLQQSRWAELPPSIQGLVTAWAGAGTLGLSPEAQFGEIFNGLLVPHELGHTLPFSTAG